jgi:hypothetical protein
MHARACYSYSSEPELGVFGSLSLLSTLAIAVALFFFFGWLFEFDPQPTERRAASLVVLVFYLFQAPPLSPQKSGTRLKPIFGFRANGPGGIIYISYIYIYGTRAGGPCSEPNEPRAVVFQVGKYGLGEFDQEKTNPLYDTAI